ncbi:general stress protein CsbD [uncultured Marixanthomonas sp.]|uniref:general stress protein CsbD n=1 Tax=uncultured Marixanthomonas sp. TaxID=757245 RepID=UPI0030DB46AF|tara:strand:+ start:49749 stop:49988 length:240 start_codon:yes stop_codon:yes gene_type:complete
MEKSNNPQRSQSNTGLENKWDNIKTSYRQKYPNLTEEDVQFREGEFDDMTQRVAERTNRNRDEVRNEIQNWDDNAYEEE